LQPAAVTHLPLAAGIEIAPDDLSPNPPDDAMSKCQVLFCLLVSSVLSVLTVEAAHAQWLRSRRQRCQPAQIQARQPSQAAQIAPPGGAEAKQAELKRVLGFFPDHTRCLVVSRKPVLVDRARLDQLESGTMEKEAILALDPHAGLAFDRYLALMTGAGLVNRPLEKHSRIFTAGQIQLVVCGQANYFLPARGPAPVTNSDSVHVYVFSRSIAQTWRQMEQDRPQQSKFGLHHEGDIAFFQDGKDWFGFAPPNILIVGDKYEYFEEVVKNAAGKGPPPQLANNFVDLVDPSATFWLAFFLDKDSPDAPSWPAHVLEYVPNEEWLVTLWSPGESISSRPRRDSPEEFEVRRRELIPGYSRQLQPLVAEGRLYGNGFEELQFSVRNYDLESGAFPVFLLGLMGIAVFI
jgi:hypothetical protein